MDLVFTIDRNIEEVIPVIKHNMTNKMACRTLNRWWNYTSFKCRNVKHSILVPWLEHPKGPIDVFLQQLAYHLQLLLEHNVLTYDVLQENFQMREVILWTRSYFPTCASSIEENMFVWLLRKISSTWSSIS